MSTDSPRQPPFYCPACGKKHRADLGALRGTAGAVAKVTCGRCETVMALRIGADGLPKCEANEPIGGPMSQPESKKPSLLLPIAAAAVVAAGISVGLLSVLKPEPAAPAPDPRIAGLEEEVRKLAVALDEATAREQALRRDLVDAMAKADARIEGAEKTVASLGETVTGIEGRAAKLSSAFLTIQKDHEDHGGRIEANRVTARQLDKRVKALEGK